MEDQTSQWGEGLSDYAQQLDAASALQRGFVNQLPPEVVAAQQKREAESRAAYEAERAMEFERQARVTALHASLQVNHLPGGNTDHILSDAREFLAFLRGDAH